MSAGVGVNVLVTSASTAAGGLVEELAISLVVAVVLADMLSVAVVEAEITAVLADALSRGIGDYQCTDGAGSHWRADPGNIDNGWSVGTVRA